MDEVWLIDPSNGGEHGRMCGKMREERGEEDWGWSWVSQDLSTGVSPLPRAMVLNPPTQGQGSLRGPQHSLSPSSCFVPARGIPGASRHLHPFPETWEEAGGGGARGIKGSQESRGGPIPWRPGALYLTPGSVEQPFLPPLPPQLGWLMTAALSGKVEGKRAQASHRYPPPTHAQKLRCLPWHFRAGAFCIY